jgi:hypothetical protein
MSKDLSCCDSGVSKALLCLQFYTKRTAQLVLFGAQIFVWKYFSPPGNNIYLLQNREGCDKFKASASQHKLGLKGDGSPGALQNHKPRARDRQSIFCSTYRALEV